MNKTIPYITIWSSLVFGSGSLLLFTVFLFLGPLKIVHLGLNTNYALLIDAGLSMLFFVQHSVMIRRGVRNRIVKYLPEEYYNALFSITSGIALILVIAFWQKTTYIVAGSSGIYYWLFRILFFLSIMGFVWTNASLGFFDPYGINAILNIVKQRRPRPMPFSIRGAYQWVRHPFYLFCLTMIWACPEATADRLLFNILWTIWICVGAVLEEKHLVIEFGEKYLDYQSKVPMIIPIRLSRMKINNSHLR